jgi:predicted 2-oxoglutarate/Fe(II)-dependent dioxygenase YbiX
MTAATAHRRFALSLNLNDDYEGGDVVFKEYNNVGYKGSAGAALIFSSALLHEVRETTRGVRYTLISHFFNDQSLQQNPQGR